MWHMNGVGWGWWLLMSVVMVAFWALVIYGVYWFARNPRSPSSGEDERETPDDVLKRRLAAGEITVDEYDRLREAITGEDREPAPR